MENVLSDWTRTQKNSLFPLVLSAENLYHSARMTPLLLLCLLVLSASAKADEWRVLHSEQGAKMSSQVPQKDSTTFNLHLPDGKAALVLGSAVNFPLVIDDLTPTLRLKSDQAGIAIGAQVVLPRTLYPGTQRPVTYIVPGTRYTGSGNWETLGFWDRNGIPNLRQESDRIAALLQAEHNTSFDTRGQYVRQIVLFAERLPRQPETKNVDVGFPNLTGYAAAQVEHAEQELLFDPLNYVGFKVLVSAKPMYLQESRYDDIEWESPLQSHVAAPLVAAPDGRPAVRTTYPDGNYVLTNQTLTNQALPQSPAALVHIRFNDGVLYLDDIPCGIRAIEYQGEPLELLRNLKFNAVWLKEPPSPEIRLEAQQAGIWLVCPPPSNAELETARVFEPGASQRTAPTIDSSYDNVLVWNLGTADNEGSHARYPADAQRAQLLQTADRLKRRPLLCTARSGVYDYSRTADILMMHREPLLTSLDMLDLHLWQRDYPTLVRPDTAFWCTIQTQPSPKLTEQWMMFEGNPSFICAVSYEQIKMQIYLAIAAKARGVLFTSQAPLNNNDPETEFRRTALELANWELQLVEEWFSAGEPLPSLARSNQSLVSSAVIQSGRSRLLVPIWLERHNQSAIGPAVVGNVRYVVPGIPETYNAYHLVPGRLMPMSAPRVAGGIQIELEEASLNSLIFFCEGDEIYAQVERRAKSMGARTAYLACRLAELELSMTEQVLNVLKRAKDANTIPVHPKDNLPLFAMPEQESMLRTTREALDLAKDLANRTPPDYARAYLQAERATRGLRYAGRSLWLEATRNDLNLCMTPVSVSFATLPLYLSLHQRTNRGTLGTNRLPGGDMEIRALEQAGWESMGHKVEGVFVAAKDVSPAAARLGQSGLRLVVAPSNPSDRPKQLETIPLWVVTPPMTVRMGELICVQGWIRIPQPLESTVDGLMIFDSLGGQELALRFLHTSGEWREFAFYRNVPTDSAYYVSFALNGIGEVHLDDVHVSAVQFDVPVPIQPSEPSSQPGPTPWRQRLNPFQYLPPLPNWGQ